MSRRLEESLRRIDRKIKKLEAIERRDPLLHNSSSVTNTDNKSGDTLIAGLSSAASLTAGNLVFLNSSKQWTKASAGNGSDGGNEHLIGIALTSTPHNSGILTTGLYNLNTSLVSGSSGTFDIGKQVFMSPDTSGSFTTIIPSGSGQDVRVLGHAVDVTIIYFNPSGDYIEI